MSAIINTLDSYGSQSIKFGENAHPEYNWSSNIQEKILQFYFQITRTDDSSIARLALILSDLLSNLRMMIETGSVYEKEIANGHLSLLYRMIGQTRDIINGKGEYKLSYMMIYVWHKFYPELAQFALKCFVIHENNIHPYGSWKDIKYFCDYCKTQGDFPDSYLIKYCTCLINEQLKRDFACYISNSNDISLVAKWVPREKSSFCWLYESLAINYFSEYLTTANTHDRLRGAILKCKTEYRKLLSLLNKYLDTLQIKQCGRDWSSINFNKVTSISLLKQKKSFLNIKSNGEVRYPYSQDRINCAINFHNHIEISIKDNSEIKGKRVSMADFTKQAFNLLRNGTQSEKDILNSQWRDNSSQNGQLKKMIAMVDVSGSMDGDPMNVAIALGIRIAEKSVLGKRIMTFSSTPTWVNLENYNDFISQVELVKNAEWGMNTNLYSALDLILNAIITNKLSPEDVQDMVLVVLSDMQIDAGDNCNKQVLYDIMREKYENAGYRVHGKAYKPPHILFWNLRSTSGFPCLSNQSNTSMMSGYSPSILNLFCEEGIESLQSCTPWSVLVKSLNHDRYKILSNKINTVKS